jgi:4-amino-4-deoxy-L-arabinose transferase-like glycosyltransferase
MNQRQWLSRGFWLFAGAHLVLWTAIPLAIQPNPPLDVVENVAWGHEWRLGYPKHPPLASWLAEAARLVGGDGGAWPIYLLGQLCVVTALWGVWRLGLELTSPSIALASVLILEATGRYTWMTLEFNHNLAVLPFFPLTALCLYRALMTGRHRWWLATGASLGLGMMAKYIVVLLGLAMAAFLMSSRVARRRATGPGPYLAVGVAVLIVLPHLVWMLATGLPTIAYAAERGQDDDGSLLRHVLNAPDFLVRQILMLEFIWIAFVPLLAWPWRVRSFPPRRVSEQRSGEANEVEWRGRFARHFLLAVGLGPCLLLLVLSMVTGMRLRAEWGMPLWSMLGLLVLFCLATRSETQVLKRAALGCALFAVVNVLLALAEGVAGPYVTGDGFRTHFPGRLLAKQVVDIWHQRFPVPLELVGGERWLAGNVAFYAPSRPSVFTNVGLRTPMLDDTACPWTSVADFRKRGGVLVWPIGREEAPLPWELRMHFPDAEVLPALVLPWQTGAPVKPVEVGVAVVAPQTATSSR